MKLFTIERIDYYRQSVSALPTDHLFDLRWVSKSILADILSFRSEGVRRAFEKYLLEGRSGCFAYKNGKVVGHALVWRRGSKGRRLFGWLPVPDGEDFVYYCRVNEALSSADDVVSSILGFMKGDAVLGVSCPRKDRFLSSALVKAGFSPVRTLLHLNILNRHWCV